MKTNGGKRKLEEYNFNEVRTSLHVASIPEQLPGRELELMQIEDKIETCIRNDTSLCLYLSGVPGTGKTATVLCGLRNLKLKAQNKELNDFNFLHLNGMQVTEPQQIYVKIWQAISLKDEKLSHGQALIKLREYFNSKKSGSKKKRPYWVIIIDELDQLVTKKQDILYNLFEWPYTNKSKTLVIAIANTMNLAERYLSPKVASRLGSDRVVFNTYEYQQLERIVSSRLANTKWFDSQAVELCARKVAAASGDARSALDICRRAVEIVEDQITKQGKIDAVVNFQVILDAIDSLCQNPTVRYIKCLSLHQKALLACLLAVTKKQEEVEVSLSDLFYSHRLFCDINHYKIPNQNQLLQLTSALIGFGIISIASSLNNQFAPLSASTSVILNIRKEDLVTAFKGDPVFLKVT